MPTVSVGEREFLKFVSDNVPTNKELRARFTGKFIETMLEKRLINKTGRNWRVTLDGQEALRQRPGIRRAFSMKAGQDRGAGQVTSCPDEVQLEMPLEIRGGVKP